MIGTIDTDVLQTSIIAREIVEHLRPTEPGHCVRIDYLKQNEALRICEYIEQAHLITDVAFHLLTTDETRAREDTRFITTDKAIEMRNNKVGRLCLFIASDLVDAAASSIANSFALIDGRTLHSHVLKEVIERLSPRYASIMRSVTSRLRGLTGNSDERRLDFALALLRNMQSDGATSPGLELWRVGLIADGDDGFLARLESNRDCTLALSRPGKLGATSRERIQSIKVDAVTTNALEIFFRRFSMNDVPTWSQALSKNPALTFDKWTFPAFQPSDLENVIIRPFRKPSGEVDPYCRLAQPDGKDGQLRARYGAKETMVVRWKTEPERPNDIDRWRIGIVLAGDKVIDELSEDSGDDLFARSIEEDNIDGKKRSVTINLNFDLDEPPDNTVRVRIVPLSSDGRAMVNSETQQPVFYDSQEFFLVKEVIDTGIEPVKNSLATTPMLSIGRIEYLLKEGKNATQIDEAGSEWLPKDLEYFRIQLNEKHTLNVGMNKTLLALEKRVLDSSHQSGCFLLDIDEIRPVKEQEFQYVPLKAERVEFWAPFWRTREAFFKRLRQSENRFVVEVAEWTQELATAALRYAQVYRELIDNLMKQKCSAVELREALALDTILIRNTGRGKTAEEAVITLPTHPLRAAWFASFTQLLREWEKQLLDKSAKEREASIDKLTLNMLAPVNVPAFAYHVDSSTTFTFFQNLRFFHGISLPVGVPDPYRRFSDVARILDSYVEQLSSDDVNPEQLTKHLKKFHDSHPYADTLVTTLLNPDRSDFFAEALKKYAATNSNDGEAGEEVVVPNFKIMAYAEDKHARSFDTFNQVRQQQVDQQAGRNTDQFLPGLTVTTRAMSQLDGQKNMPPEAHIAVVTDFTRPNIVASSKQTQHTNDTTSSFSLYGLICRFVSQFSVDNEGLLWRHSIVTEGVRKPEPHPAGLKYTDVCLELQETLLLAGGRLLGGQNSAKPVLEVRLDENKRSLLEKLHTNTNWVVTLDRFFTLDYYDSPNQPGLDTVARKYVLDYSPDFTDGLGHRMMVTTAWHEEIESLLSQAMDELGFSAIDESVSHLLHYLKTISGRLALDAIESSTNASAAVGLGVVTAWLQKNGRLRQSVLIPVDITPRLFSSTGTGKSNRGERRCDLVLISLKRNIVDATFIEVKWRRGNTPLELLAKEMVLQMDGSSQAMRSRFFDKNRVDGALQRSYLANVLRFYFERSRRYNLFESEAETAFLEHIMRLEKTGLDFRPTYEGYIVKLDDMPRDKPLLSGEAKITLLTARDFASEPALLPATTPSLYQQSTRNMPLVKEMSSYEVAVENAGAVGAEEVIEDDEEPTEKRQAVRVTTSPVQAPSQSPVSNANGVTKPTHETLEGNSAPSQVINNLLQENDAHAVLEQVTIPLGETAGEPVVWEPGVKGSPHLFVLGIPGQGKSWTVTRILSKLAQQSVPALVLDFHGQFADPSEDFVKAAHPNVLDASRGLPFSPFECTQGNGQGGWMASALAVSEIFAYVAGLGEMQKDVVYTSIRDAYIARGFSNDPDETKNVPLEYPTLKEVLELIEENEHQRNVKNVTARCRPLLEMNLFRPTENVVDLLTLVRNGLVIDLHNLYAETLQMATGAFVLRKLYKDMFRWGYADRLRLAIVLDEAHRLAKDITLPKLMKEGRKFGIAVIVASQGLADFHPDVLSNAGTKVIFRMNYPESRKASGFIRTIQSQDLAERIEQLSVGSAYVQTPEMKYGSVVKMYPLGK